MTNSFLHLFTMTLDELQANPFGVMMSKTLIVVAIIIVLGMLGCSAFNSRRSSFSDPKVPVAAQLPSCRVPSVHKPVSQIAPAFAAAIL